MPLYVFKEHSERNCATEVKVLSWNSKFDLLALATAKGDTSLQRIFWRKAWDYNNPFDSTISVSALCWSPRGDCLCVFYSNLHAHFLEIENGKLMHQIVLSSSEFNFKKDEEISVVTKWFQTDELDLTRSLDLPDLVPDLKLSQKAASSGSIFKTNKVQPTFHSVFLNEDYSKYLTLLIFARGSQIDAYLEGYLHLYSINLKDLQNCAPKCLDLQLSTNFKQCTILFADRLNTQISCYELNMKKFADKIVDVNVAARRLGKSLTAYVSANTAMKSIVDSWEDILKDIAEKFRRFARDKWAIEEDATIGDEFITVLAYGTFSPELQAFLTQDLNEKSLKKLVQNLDNTYANLRRLVSSTLIISLTTLFYHLTQLKQFSGSNFHLVNARDLQETLNHCQSAVLKAREMLNVLDSSLKDFKLFFAWLQKVCAAVVDDDRGQHPLILSSSTSAGVAGFDQFPPNDTNRILNFIQDNFVVKYAVTLDEDSMLPTTEPLFKLEKVGQYLKGVHLDSKFAVLTSLDQDKSWNKDTSLVQEVKTLSNKFEQLLANISESVSKSDWIKTNNIQNWPVSDSNTLNAVDCSIKFYQQTNSFRIFFYSKFDNKIEIFDKDKQNLFVKRCDLLCPNDFTMENLCEYNQTSTCLLVRQSEQGTSEQGAPSVQYKIAMINDRTFDVPSGQMAKIVTLEDNSENIKLQTLKSGPYCQWAVCGPRKISCVLFSCRTRLKLLEMDPDEVSSMSFEDVEQNDL